MARCALFCLDLPELQYQLGQVALVLKTKRITSHVSCAAVMVLYPLGVAVE